MSDNKNLSEIQIKDQKIIANTELNLLEALIPVVALMSMLAYNIFFVESQELLGAYTNQYILLIAAGIAVIVGLLNKVTIQVMANETLENLKKVLIPILILILVGALSGTWLVSGIIPAMVYYGLMFLSPEIFLPASILIAIIVSLATGSSWTTTATVGIALIGIGTALGIPTGMVAGAVISGAYFGDKMSPLSDTTNLAPAMAGTDLFTHIRYMAITTTPTIIITFIVFVVINMNIEISGSTDVEYLLTAINKTFIISPWLFLVPLSVILLILIKTKPLIALGTGIGLAIIFALIFQPNVIKNLSNSKSKALMNAVITNTNIEVNNQEMLSTFNDDELKVLKLNTNFKDLFTDEELDKSFSTENYSMAFLSFDLTPEVLKEKVVNLKKLVTLKKLEKLFSAKGIEGMVWTILLIIAAMIFGGIMDGIGALAKITSTLLKMAKSIFGLFSSTVLSCMGLNIIASDQYLAIVIPGKMYEKAFADRDLAPENLSRTLEDSGTVTSVLVPWNTCGAYQSTTLGVGVGEYFTYAIFNWLSPIMTLIVAGFNIKIRQLVKK
jgi:NhaC family Na+:H+ antiporter